MGVTPREIVDKVFTKSFRGYDEEEVDLYLDEIIKELESNNHEIQQQRARISELTARLSAVQQAALPPNMLATQRSAEEFLASANMKARAIVQQAEQGAQSIREKAEEDAKERIAQAEESAKEILRKAEREAALLIQKAQREAIGFTGTVDEDGVRERLLLANTEQPPAPAPAGIISEQPESEASISDQIERLMKMLNDLSSRDAFENREGKNGAAEYAKETEGAAGQAEAPPSISSEGLPPFDPEWKFKPADRPEFPPMPPARQEPYESVPPAFEPYRPAKLGSEEGFDHFVQGILPFEQDDHDLLPEEAASNELETDQGDEFVSTLAKLGINL